VPQAANDPNARTKSNPKQTVQKIYTDLKLPLGQQQANLHALQK
jgi:hypothetical protein